jgi:hypothetical protein
VADFGACVGEVADLYVGEGLSREVAVIKASGYVSARLDAVYSEKIGHDAPVSKSAPVSVGVSDSELQRAADRAGLGPEVASALDDIEATRVQIVVAKGLDRLHVERERVDAELEAELEKHRAELAEAEALRRLTEEALADPEMDELSKVYDSLPQGERMARFNRIMDRVSSGTVSDVVAGLRRVWGLPPDSSAGSGPGPAPGFGDVDRDFAALVESRRRAGRTDL